MTRDQKFATGVLLLVVGVIWLFFVVIWMPPLLSAVILILVWLRIDGFLPSGPSSFYMEYGLSLSLIGYAIYLLVRNRAKTIARPHSGKQKRRAKGRRLNFLREPARKPSPSAQDLPDMRPQNLVHPRLPTRSRVPKRLHHIRRQTN